MDYRPHSGLLNGELGKIYVAVSDINAGKTNSIVPVDSLPKTCIEAVITE